MKRMELLANSIPPLLMLFGAALLLQNQILKGFSMSDPTEVLLVLAGVLLGSTGIERLLAMKGIVDTRRSLVAIESKIDHLGKAKLLIGELEIENAAIDLVSNCSPRSFVKSTAQYSFTGGLVDRYYTLISAKMKEADALGLGFFYNAVVADQDVERARSRRDPFLKDFPGRYEVRGGKAQWPFDVLIGGDRMIFAISGQNRRSHNCGFYIHDRDTVAVAEQWFEEVVWGAARANQSPTHGQAERT